MMMQIIALALLAVASVQAFNNPVLGPGSLPSAIKVDDTYYVVTAGGNATTGKFPIHSSTDLKNWKLAGHVFDDSNIPTWPRNDSFTDPKIHQIGGNFVIYFSALKQDRLQIFITAASAPHPLGPYTAIDRPLLISEDVDKNVYYPNIINDEGKLYLMYWGAGIINARQLNSNGLSFASDQVTKILQPSVAWESGYVLAPWYFRRGDFHYLMYMGGAGCSGVTIGAARSTTALGPYETLPRPILPSNSNYDCTGDPSVVQGLHAKKDLIFFTASRTDDIMRVSTVMLSYLAWGEDNWPYVEDY